MEGHLDPAGKESCSSVAIAVPSLMTAVTWGCGGASGRHHDLRVDIIVNRGMRSVQLIPPHARISAAACCDHCYWLMQCRPGV